MNNSPKKNLVERLETMEFQMSRVAALESLSTGLRKTVTTVIEMVNALVEEMGGAELGAKITGRLDEKRAEQRRVEADRSAAILKQLVDSGQVLATDAVAEDSIVVGTENTPDGRIKDEKLQINLMSFNEDVRKELLGKGVGYAVEREGVKVFVVEGIYKMNPTPALQVPAPDAIDAPPASDAVPAPTDTDPPIEAPAAPVAPASDNAPAPEVMDTTPVTEVTPVVTDAPVLTPSDATVAVADPTQAPTDTPADALAPAGATTEAAPDTTGTPSS